jgi:hypothetical protein
MTSLLNFDQVVALTQQTINTQFELMFLNGTIDKNLNFTIPSNDKIGVTATLNSPTVSIALNKETVNPQQVRFNINIDTGSATYYSPVGKLESEDISGYSITLNVNLTKLTVNPDYTGLKVGNSTKAVINPFLNQDMYTVTAILLDFDNLNYSTAEIYNKNGVLDPNSTLTTLFSEITNALIKDGNPYLISVHPKDTQAVDTGIDAFKPTAVMYNTHLYNNTNAASDLSTYNMCIMNQQHPLPWTNVTLPKFTQNLITDTNTYGRMFISNSQFCSAYIEDLVLPVLKNAMGANADFTKNGNSWGYDHQTNQNNQHDGHGIVVGSDSGILDIYGNQQVHNSCTLNFNPADSTANSIVLNGSGYFYIKTDYYERPLGIWAHDAWNSAKKSFSFTITLEAGADGKITISFTLNSPAAVTHTWENFVIKFADLFNAGLQSSLDATNGCYTSFENGEFSNFSSNASSAFNVLESMVILPAATSYFFKNASLDSSTGSPNIQFDLTTKN